MLAELRVENLLLIERAELRLAAGLNVLTGETGAGKTVLAHALDLLLGGRTRGSPVRPDAGEAYVEGVFELTARLRRRLAERLPADAEELVLARRVTSDGRSRAYLNGRSIGVGDLRELAGGLLTFYGQHEHRKLTLASAQLEVLDGFCGGKQGERRAAYATAYSRRRETMARLQALREVAGSRDRELDLLQYELAEIEAAAPDEREDAELRGERDRLRAAEDLRTAAMSGAEALVPDPGGPGAATLVAEAAARLETLSGVDPRLDGLAQRLRGLVYEAEDLGRELRSYQDEVESSPHRLEEVEERLAVLDRLKRKHGGTVEAVLAHAARCRARRDELAGAELALEQVAAELESAESELAEHARVLSAARRTAAPKLAAAVCERLGELAMHDAGFEVRLTSRDERGPAGDEDVDFMIAPNPGVPAGPVREIASGGELSRVMLALMGLAAEAGTGDSPDTPRLLVFDEVDAGIGGHTARAVGARLRSLARDHQVLCITHLPQVASRAERHFRIVKDTGGTTARAVVDQLEGGEVERELVRMLGAAEGDAAARRHARQLLRAA
ncbi:MAG: DNA repair protein RecN [Solirubrobacteraceae bacterium]